MTLIYNAPKTVAALRVDSRTELKDENRKRYRDSHLNGWTHDAINDYARHFPRQGETAIACTAGTTCYRLLSDARSVQTVQYLDADSTSYCLEYKPFKGGETDAAALVYGKLGLALRRPGIARLYPGHYGFRDGELLIDFEPEAGDSLIVRHGGRYILPPFDSMRLDVAEDLELIRLYACGKATVRTEGQSANLQRRDEGSGQRDDNP